jgi:hypothetical protein
MAWQWMSQRGSPPLLLAGPILRRVEPTLVSAWVATTSAQNIALTVSGGGAQVASNVTAAQPAGQSTVQLGDNLFVALLTAVPATALTPGVLYTYSLAFTAVPDGTVTEFAKAFSGAANDSLASIVYTGSGTEAALPSFSLPPTTLSQVKIAHASCRKAGGENPDALPLLDGVIAAARAGATDADFALNRLHQLFLTGDQFYADDVADSYLAMCIDAAGWLMGARKEPAPAMLGILGPADSAGQHSYPTQATGWPDNSASRPLGGSTPWDPSTWPAVAARGQLVFAAGYTVTPPDTTSLGPVKLLGDAKHYKDARNHLIALGEFYAALLLAWSPVLWCPGTPDWPVPLPYDEKNLAAVLGSGGSGASPDEDAPDVAFFGAGAQAVRRVLANVPTYMICDDHDVTDDWFMNRLWCERVLNLDGDTLGRRMVRNALIAFAIFQAWGNSPDLFDPAASGPPPGAQLLAQLAAGHEMTEDLTMSSATGVSSLVGMPQPLAATAPALSRPAGSIPWNYRWAPAGWPYEVIVLDCRTLRRYGPGEIQPPQLLDDGSASSPNPDQFAAQLGSAPPSGTLTLVVVQTPVLGVRFIEDLFERTSSTKTAFDHDAEAWSLSDNGYQLMLARLAAHNHMVVLLSGDVHYSFAASVDFWATTPWGADSAPAGQPVTARIAQLTSSAARNEDGKTRFLHNLGYSLLMPASETWAGFAKPPSYDSITAATEIINLPAIERMNTSPSLLDAGAYEDIFGGAATPPAPDWKYRIDFATGKRDNPPSFTPPVPLATMPAALGPVAAYLTAFVAYAQAAAGTEIIGRNNVCVVTFSGQDESSWHVQQAVMWRPDPGSGAQSIPDDLTQPSDVTRYDIPLQYGPEPTLS